MSQVTWAAVDDALEDNESRKAIRISGHEQLIVQSVGARGESTTLQSYVAKLCQYLVILPENKVELPRDRLGLRTDARGANACAGYALAALEQYLVVGRTTSRTCISTSSSTSSSTSDAFETMSQVTWAAVDDALEDIKKSFEAIDVSERKGMGK
eukprot:g2818.t1